MRVDLWLRPESELLLWCIRCSTGSAEELPPRIRPSDLDWPYIVDVSRQAAVMPLILETLETIAAQSAPGPILERLRRERYGNNAMTMFRFKQLKQVLRAFDERGIPVIVLKGSALAETVYATPALRPMGDIDLLVRNDDVSQAEDTLVHLDYRLVVGPRDAPRDRNYHVRYRIERGVPVEIHWALEDPWKPVRVDLEGIWRRARPATVAGCPALIIAPEDLVPHLCLHTACHNKLEHSLQGLCDISLTIRRNSQSFDWGVVEQRAHEWKITKYAYLALRLTRELLDAPIPDSILSALEPSGKLQPAALEGAVRTVVERYQAPPMTLTFVRFWSSGGLSETARALVSSLSLESIASSPPGGTRHAYLRYPFRLFDLSRRYGPLMARLMYGDPRSQGMIERERAVLSCNDRLNS